MWNDVSNKLIDSKAKYQINIVNNSLFEYSCVPKSCQLVNLQDFKDENAAWNSLTAQDAEILKFRSRLTSNARLEDDIEISKHKIEDTPTKSSSKTKTETKTETETRIAASNASGTIFIIPNNTNVTTPIYINYVTNDNSNDITAKTTNTSSQQEEQIKNKNITDKKPAFENYVFVKPFSEVTIIEHFLNQSSNKSTNYKTNIVLGKNAKVNYYMVQFSNSNAENAIETVIHQSKNSMLNSIVLASKTLLNDISLTVNLNEDKSKCNLHILSNATNQETHNINLDVNHKAKHTHCEVICKSILNDSANVSFLGNIFVDAIAVKTNANLLSKSLLLSEDVTSNSIPQLEINCDDVKCSHGATCGYLDENAIYYLRTRGIPEDIARKLVINAFATTILSNVKVQKLYNYYYNHNLSEIKHDIRENLYGH